MNTLRDSVMAAALLIGVGIGAAQATDYHPDYHPAGGAPSPEINAMLGLMLAGSTVAFLRRRRTGKAK